MSNREMATRLLNNVPDYKLIYAIAYLQGLTAGYNETPNAETIAAIKEVDEMISSGAGEHYAGSTDSFLASLLED